METVQTSIPRLGEPGRCCLRLVALYTLPLVCVCRERSKVSLVHRIVARYPTGPMAASPAMEQMEFPTQRRPGFSSEPMSLEDFDTEARVYPKSDAARASIERSLRGNFLFCSLSASNIQEMVDAMDYIEISKDHQVIVEGACVRPGCRRDGRGAAVGRRRLVGAVPFPVARAGAGTGLWGGSEMWRERE